MNFVFICVYIGFAVSLAVISDNCVVAHRVFWILDVVEVESSFFGNSLKFEIEFLTDLDIPDKL